MASALSDCENNALWMGSLLAVPPPAPRTQPLAGSTTLDLPGSSLTQWAMHVQDVTSGMRLPPEVAVNCPQADIVRVLNWLERMTPIRYCRLCLRSRQKVWVLQRTTPDSQSGTSAVDTPSDEFCDHGLLHRNHGQLVWRWGTSTEIPSTGTASR